MTTMPPRLNRREFFTMLTSAGTKPKLAIPTTANAAFFRPLHPQVPRLNADYWSLTLGGLVTRPVTWSFADLMALPQTEIECTLLCAANEPGGERIGHARWRGVAMKTLLAEIDRSAEARFARLEAADGHITSVPLERLASAVLAFAMNGEPLAAEQGFPARLIVPGLYDYKMPGWIERIDLTSEAVPGDWEARGWPLDGIVATTSAVTSHRPFDPVGGIVVLQGYAFAGDRAVDSVQISIDGGDWTDVPFEPGPPASWSRWALDWQPTSAGDTQIAVRAVDVAGQMQQTPHTLTLRATGD